VSPEEQSDESFDWDASLEAALSAFTHRDGAAAHLLGKALDDSARMANLCQHELLRLSPGKMPDETLEDWYEFLTKLNDYMSDVFRVSADFVDSGNSGGLQRAFQDIGAAALTALMAVKYMDMEGPPREGRQRAVEELRKLRYELLTGKTALERRSGVNEAARTSKTIDSPEVVPVRILGRIAAGQPITAVESPEEELFSLPRQLVVAGELFMVEVDGDSMMNVGILNGDLVVVRKQPDAENGEVVAARLDEEVTVKTLKRSGGHVWLVPENPAYEKILGDNAVILGKVVTVIRKV
jgi:repressor LexA